MIVRKYGVKLVRVRKKDIELIRQQRNSAFVRQFMLYRDTITKKMQESWFRTINNDQNVYFLIMHGRKKIGLTYSGNIDWKAKSAEGGIFIWDQNYVSTPIPVIASILSFELFFGIFGLKQSRIKVLKSNKRAIEFNEMTGFRKISDDPAKAYYDYSISVDDYRKKTRSLVSSLQKMTGDDSPLSEKDIDFSRHRTRADLELYAHLPARYRKHAVLPAR